FGGTVAPVDCEGEAGRLVRRGWVGGREGEVAGLAADAVGRAGDARRRCDVVPKDRRLDRRPGAAGLIGSGQGHHVLAVFRPNGRGEFGAVPRGNVDAVLGHAPVVSEASLCVLVAGVGDGAAQGDRRPLRTVARRRGSGDRCRRGDVVDGQGEGGR